MILTLMNDLDKRLLNDFQRDWPLSPHPYADIAQRLGVAEEQVIQSLKRLQVQGKITRVGPVFAPRRIGASTLAAAAVPEHRLQTVAEIVNTYPEVNHNYEREHVFNLWFVVTACDQQHLDKVLADIEEDIELPVMSLPLEHDYHIDLGFRMRLV